MQKVIVSHYLTTEDKKQLLEKNNWLAAQGVILHWLTIVFAFALVHFYTNAFTIIVALFILGGKQLACAILMHDAGHHSVFTNRKANDIIGNWLGAYPLFQHIDKYRSYHYQHHINTGLEEDPDILLTRGYPASKWGIFRKFLRDLSGITGIKIFLGLLLINLGLLEYNLGKKVVFISPIGKPIIPFFKNVLHNFFGPVIFHFTLFIILYFFAEGWLYLLWIGAFLTTFQFCIRVRSIAEHSVVENNEDPFLNTRTTYANALEKLLFAPYNVNYHAEHHMLMSVPSYNLPKMHELIKQNGFYNKGVLETGYLNIIKMAVLH